MNSSLYETALITINDYLVYKFLEKKINFQKLIKLIYKISNLKEFQKFKKIQPKNIKDINNLRDYVGTNCEVLIEKESKKSSQFWCGRNSQNIMVVFPKKDHKPGDMISVKIIDNTSTTLIGRS